MRYVGDPYWVTARYPGTCAKCGTPFPKGTRVFYYPKGKRLYSEACAVAAANDFEAAAADEAFMNFHGGGNGWYD